MKIFLLRKALVKKGTCTFLFLLLFFGPLYSQMGCTDILANNYDPSAVQNDGSCTYDPVTISVINTYPLDAVLSETSGLIFWDDKLWTHNDNGDTILYKINPSDGSIAGNVSLYPQVNTDWEEISQDDDYMYVGDFGNNTHGNRTELKIIRVSKASIATGTPEMEIINFVYEDQTDFTSRGPNNTNYDCEAFIITDDEIFLFTKEWVSHKTRVYKMPKIPGTYQAELQETYDINGLVTGSVYIKDKGIIALSGYTGFLQPFIFLLYDFTGNDFFGGNKRRLNINLPFYQVEGITSEDGLNFFISNERFDTMGTVQQLHTLDLAPFLVEHLSVSPLKDSADFKIFPNPTTSILKVGDIHSLFPIKYIIVDMAAKKVEEGMLTAQNSTIDFSELPVGSYSLKLGEKTLNSFRVIKK